MKDKLGIYHVEDDLTMESEYLTFELLIQRIVDTLSQFENESIVKIANKILTNKISYDERQNKFCLERKK